MKPASLAVLALLSMPVLSAQVAPQSITDSLIEIGGGIPWSNNLTLLRADGTYQDIALQYKDPASGQLKTSTPANGSYSYSTVSGLPNQATITFYSSANSNWTVTLSFLSSNSGRVGTSLLEFQIYPRIAVTGAANVSNNSWISAAHPTIPGFVIEGSSPRWVLIRGAGPSLAQFGVPSPVANPQMTISFLGTIPGIPTISGVNISNVSSNEGETVTNIINSWSSDPNLVPGLQTIFSLVGAFQFQSGSSDCAALALLSPGAYTVQASSSGADGQLLTEVYILPYDQISP